MKNLFIYTFTAATLCLTSCEKEQFTKTDGLVVSEEVRTGNKEENTTGKYYLTSQSVAQWNGAGPAANHIGTFAVESEDIKIKKGNLHSGSFVIPIASITNFDLPEELKPVLLNHLKSPDFFNMALYPEAKFNITAVQPYTGNDQNVIEGANTLITGDFTMLNQTHSITFPARIDVAAGKMQAEAKIIIDRSKWGMNYGADTALGDHHIYPNVNIHLKLVGLNK
jgi:polyisoprenoid-binding protein YceI